MDSLFWTSRQYWWERVNNTVIEFHLSETSRSSRERTRAARLIDRDANDCAISPPPAKLDKNNFHNAVQFITLGFQSENNYKI